MCIYYIYQIMIFFYLELLIASVLINNLHWCCCGAYIFICVCLFIRFRVCESKLIFDFFSPSQCCFVVDRFLLFFSCFSLFTLCSHHQNLMKLFEREKYLSIIITLNGNNCRNSFQFIAIAFFLFSL